MGRKITIDSATLDEQGARGDRGALAVRRGAPIRSTSSIHPQSVVHSMVELVDGSVIAQLGVTDMRLPIQYAFSYPERWPAPVPPLDLARAGRSTSMRPTPPRFPCLRAGVPGARGGAQPAGRAERRQRDRGGVDSWRARFGFPAIARVIERTMDAHQPAEVATLRQVRAVDRVGARACPRDLPAG